MVSLVKGRIGKVDQGRGEFDFGVKYISLVFFC